MLSCLIYTNDRIGYIHITYFLKCRRTPLYQRSLHCLGPATRCDEMYHFTAILRLLEASQATADHRRCLPENRSSVASQLATMECFQFLLRCSSQRKCLKIFNLEIRLAYHTKAYEIPITIKQTACKSHDKWLRYS